MYELADIEDHEIRKNKLYERQGFFVLIFYRTNCLFGKYVRQAFGHRLTENYVHSSIPTSDSQMYFSVLCFFLFGLFLYVHLLLRHFLMDIL